MKNARCLQCKLIIRGRWKSGPPKCCPACGYSESAKDLKKIAQERIKR